MWHMRSGLSVTLIVVLAMSAVPVAAEEPTETTAGPIARAVTRGAVQLTPTGEPTRSVIETVQQGDKPAAESN